MTPCAVTVRLLAQIKDSSTSGARGSGPSRSAYP